MDIKRWDDGKHGVFDAIEGVDVLMGKMVYHYASPEKIVIEHTEVPAQYEGRGVGGQLIGAAVKFAREKGIKIDPLCPFANATFKRHTEYADVLDGVLH